MKKFFESMAKAIIVLFAFWVLASWVDVMADNSQPNPEHHKWNVFTVFAFNDEVRAKVDLVNTVDNTIVFDDGDDYWIAEVEDASQYKYGDEYTIVFKRNNPKDKYDDELIDIKKQQNNLLLFSY